jgi:hypothetical protein
MASSSTSSTNNFEEIKEKVVDTLIKMVDRDRKTVIQMKKKANEIELGTLDREQLMTELGMMVETNAQGVGLLFLMDVEKKDVEVMRGMKDLFENMEESMRVRVNYVNSVE